jgi:hypothetical protein
LRSCPGCARACSRPTARRPSAGARATLAPTARAPQTDSLKAATVASTGAPCALHACRSVLAVLNLVRIADRFRLLLLLGALPPAARGGLLAYAKPGVAAAAGMQGTLHRVGPDFGSTLTVSNRDSQSNGWVSWKIMGRPCGFQASVRRAYGNLRCGSRRRTWQPPLPAADGTACAASRPPARCRRRRPRRRCHDRGIIITRTPHGKALIVSGTGYEVITWCCPRRCCPRWTCERALHCGLRRPI